MIYLHYGHACVLSQVDRVSAGGIYQLKIAAYTATEAPFVPLSTQPGVVFDVPSPEVTAPENRIYLPAVQR